MNAIVCYFIRHAVWLSLSPDCVCERRWNTVTSSISLSICGFWECQMLRALLTPMYTISIYTYISILYIQIRSVTPFRLFFFLMLTIEFAIYIFNRHICLRLRFMLPLIIQNKITWQGKKIFRSHWLCPPY